MDDIVSLAPCRVIEEALYISDEVECMFARPKVQSRYWYSTPGVATKDDLITIVLLEFLNVIFVKVKAYR